MLVLPVQHEKEVRPHQAEGDGGVSYVERIQVRGDMTEMDKQRIEEAYSSTYRSTITRLICEADTDECRERLVGFLHDPEMQLED